MNDAIETALKRIEDKVVAAKRLAREENCDCDKVYGKLDDIYFDVMALGTLLSIETHSQR